MKKGTSRREFLKRTGKGVVAASMVAGFPTIVPSTVFGKTSPGNRVNVGMIGTGRISRVHDMPGVWKYDKAHIIAVCDLDSKRVQDAKDLANGYYTKTTGKPYDGVATYTNYHELLGNKDIDAVVISTPDHWHAEPVLAAAVAGKHVYVQKPLSMTLLEGRLISNTLRARKTVFQIGSQ